MLRPALGLRALLRLGAQCRLGTLSPPLPPSRFGFLAALLYFLPQPQSRTLSNASG